MKQPSAHSSICPSPWTSVRTLPRAYECARATVPTPFPWPRPRASDALERAPRQPQLHVLLLRSDLPELPQHYLSQVPLEAAALQTRRVRRCPPLWCSLLAARGTELLHVPTPVAQAAVAARAALCHLQLLALPLALQYWDHLFAERRHCPPHRPSGPTWKRQCHRACRHQQTVLRASPPWEQHYGCREGRQPCSTLTLAAAPLREPTSAAAVGTQAAAQRHLPWAMWEGPAPAACQSSDRRVGEWRSCVPVRSVFPRRAKQAVARA